MAEFSSLTRGVRAGIDTDPIHGAVVPPVYLSTTYSFTGLGEGRGYDYSRSGNPTRSVLAGAIADLEGGHGGIVTASGMGAVSVLLHGLLGRGRRLVVPHDCYGGSWRLFDVLSQKGLFDLSVVDLTSPDGVAEAIALKPDVVWVESPSNPLLRLTDIAPLAAAAHEVGALVVVDNTFCSPVLQRPIELGADVVLHSSTKYINGHSDVVLGAVVTTTAEQQADLSWWANCLGLTGGALDSYLALRGLRTIFPRMRSHNENAAAVADALARHPAVAAVHYPGLPDHPGHELAARQQSGFGGIVSFELRGGEPAVRALLSGLRCYSLAESLGGVESLISHSASMTHAAMPPDVQAAAGITPGLLRLSVGIEAAEDLVADLVAGLDRAEAASA